MEKDLNNEQQRGRRWYELKVMDTRIILATFGGVLLAAGFLLETKNEYKWILILLGSYLVYKGRYY